MVRAKRQGRERPAKIEQRKIRGLALSLPPSLPELRCSSLLVFGSTCPHASKMGFPALSKIK